MDQSKTTKAVTKKPKSRKKAATKKKPPVQATPVEGEVVVETPDNGVSESNKVRDLLLSVKNKMKITKVTATRCVKTKRGDHFVAFSSEWDSVRDDSEIDVVEGSVSGMSLKEASLALAILQFKADTAAIDGAFLAGDISETDRDHEIRQLRSRYGSKLKEMAHDSTT